MQEMWLYTLDIKRRWKPRVTYYNKCKVYGKLSEVKKKAIQYTREALTKEYGGEWEELCLDGWQTLRWRKYRISHFISKKTKNSKRRKINCHIWITPGDNPDNKLFP